MDHTCGEMENPEENNREDMIDMEDIQVSLSRFGGENSGEEPSKITTGVEEEIDRRETQNGGLKRPHYQALLFGITIVLLYVLFIQIIIKQQSLNQVQMENNELKKLLNFTHQNVTLLGSQLNVILYINLLSDKNTQLSLLLKKTLQEKKQLQDENEELNTFLNSTLENCDLAEEANRQLNLVLNRTLSIIAMASAESTQWRQLLSEEQQTSKQLEAEKQLQHSILFSNKLSFLWRFCSKDTLQCSHCMPGWVEHASRCFFLPEETKKWEDARRECLDMGGDLAVVLNAEDQAFLTNMTFQFGQQHPQERLHSAWIGLQDMVKEGVYIWVNGNRIHRDVLYWRHPEPNNAMVSGDEDGAGQDCVAIVPPSRTGQKDWLKSWDDIVCSDKQHYLCETTALFVQTDRPAM